MFTPSQLCRLHHEKRAGMGGGGERRKRKREIKRKRGGRKRNERERGKERHRELFLPIQLCRLHHEKGGKVGGCTERERRGGVTSSNH